MSFYFIIDGRDGDTTVHKCTKKELLLMLNDGEAFDECEFIQMAPDTWEQVAHFGEDGVLIIRGQDIVPVEKKSVTVWEVE